MQWFGKGSDNVEDSRGGGGGGGKFALGVFDIVKLLGKEETAARIANGIIEFNA